MAVRRWLIVSPRIKKFYSPKLVVQTCIIYENKVKKKTRVTVKHSVSVRDKSREVRAPPKASSMRERWRRENFGRFTAMASVRASVGITLKSGGGGGGDHAVCVDEYFPRDLAQ